MKLTLLQSTCKIIQCKADYFVHDHLDIATYSALHILHDHQNMIPVANQCTSGISTNLYVINLIDGRQDIK